jgi:hypothetical protein
MTGRHVLLLLGLLVSAVLAWLGGDEPDTEVAQPVARQRPATAVEVAGRSDAGAARPREALPSIDPLLDRSAVAETRTQTALGGTLFAAKSWAPPPPPAGPQAAANAAPVAPAVPPLPFRYIGQQRAGENEQFFLAEGEQLHVVSLHSVIRGLYRVDGVSARAIDITYLPMNLSQKLATGSSDR